MLITGLCHINIIVLLTHEYHRYLLVQVNKGVVFEPFTISKTFPTFLQVLKPKTKMNVDK